MTQDPLQLSRDERIEHVGGKRNQAHRALEGLRASNRKQTETLDHLTLFLAASRSVVMLLDHLFGADARPYKRADPVEKGRRANFDAWMKASTEFKTLRAHHLAEARDRDTHRLFLPDFEIRGAAGELLLRTGSSLRAPVGLMRAGIGIRGGLPRRVEFGFSGHGLVVDECSSYFELTDCALSGAKEKVVRLWP